MEKRSEEPKLEQPCGCREFPHKLVVSHEYLELPQSGGEAVKVGPLQLGKPQRAEAKGHWYEIERLTLVQIKARELTERTGEYPHPYLEETATRALLDIIELCAQECDWRPNESAWQCAARIRALKTK